MKDKFRNSIIVFLYLTGFHRLYYAYFKFRNRSITRIIVFHKIKNLSLFEKKLKWLKDNCHVVSLENYLSGVISKSRVNVCITFDDGYKNWLDAVPLLEKYQMPAVFFVAAQFIDSEDRFSAERFCQNELGISYDPNLNWDDVSYIASRPGFEIGSHTLSHPDLTNISYDRLVTEIVESKRHIAKKTKNAVKYFAYPFGHYCTFNAEIARAVEHAGYECALTMVPGVNCTGKNRFLLFRDGLDETCPQLTFQAWISGNYDLIKRAVDSFRINLGLKA